MTPSKQEIEASLERICAHKLFEKSALYARLLTYLVKKHDSGEDLKEFTIGADLFGKEYGINHKEGAVRSYMYQLRKRLKAYYDDPNTKESFRFEIKKGQYNLSLEAYEIVSGQELQGGVETGKNESPKRRFNYLIPFLATILILVCIGLFQMFSKVEVAYFWEPFLDSDESVKVVISDQFMVVEINDQGEPHASIYGAINSVDDFVEYTAKHPERKLKNADYTLMSKMTPFSIKRFSEWFFEHDRNFSFQLESQLNYEDVKENHLVFVGQFKTMNISKSLFLRNSEVFSTHRDGFKCKGKDGIEKAYNTVFRGDEYIEYAMVSYDSFTPRKKVLYLVSNNDIGVMSMVRNFTDKVWLAEFMRNLPSDDEVQFNALFEVAGIQRNDVSCELVELEIVKLKPSLR